MQALDRMGQVKTVVFPTDQPPGDSDPAAHELYVKTHAAYHPGEQRRRNYDWPTTGVNPITHSFGAVDKVSYQQGVRKALQPGLDQTLEQPAKVSNKIYEDFKSSATDYLGKPKKLGAGDRPLAPNHTYGLPSLRHGPEPGVDQLLAGTMTPEEQGPDADLGKSIREGWRNIAPAGKTFGLPSIRTDIPMPKTKSCANTVNFGNEPDAQQLLRPPRSVERGVNEEHYMALRGRDEVQELMVEAGIDLSSGDFDKVFAIAAEADGEQDQCCLVRDASQGIVLIVRTAQQYASGPLSFHRFLTCLPAPFHDCRTPSSEPGITFWHKPSKSICRFESHTIPLKYQI